MYCAHKYFAIKDGVLRCSVCGKTPDEIRQTKPVCDKAATMPENKNDAGRASKATKKVQPGR
jgi:hypothetical protein